MVVEKQFVRLSLHSTPESIQYCIWCSIKIVGYSVRQSIHSCRLTVVRQVNYWRHECHRFRSIRLTLGFLEDLPLGKYINAKEFPEHTINLTAKRPKVMWMSGKRFCCWKNSSIHSLFIYSGPPALAFVHSTWWVVCASLSPYSGHIHYLPICS